MSSHYVGTSGWSYDHWTGSFYPEQLPAEERLRHYAGRLHSTEINYSFYQLPAAATLRNWRAVVPEGFVFAAKASRYITHMKKLKDPEAGLSQFLPRMDLLEDRLGPILFQLPPRWRCNIDRLKAFLATLDRAHRYAFEFRDQSWINVQVLDLLAEHKAAFCIYELDGFESPQAITADFVYLRLHGPYGAYRGDYDRQTLGRWADRMAGWLDQGCDVYGYFDNDEAGYAAGNALTLCGLLDKRRAAGAW